MRPSKNATPTRRQSAVLHITRGLVFAIGLLVLGTGTPAAQAVTVVSNSNVELSAGDAVEFYDYMLTVFQDSAATDFTSIHFDFDGLTIGQPGTVLDEGSDWFRVAPGQVFSGRQLADGLFPDIQDQPVPGGVFYLGVNTGRRLGIDDVEHPRDVYGWAAFENTVSGLVLLDSAVAYDFSIPNSLKNGIVVGTTTTVPEPGHTILIGLGLIALARRNPTPEFGLNCTRLRKSPGRLNQQITENGPTEGPSLGVNLDAAV